MENQGSLITDEDGNTHLHRVILAERTEVIEELALEKPQELFIVNRQGQTPLDMCIEDDEPCKILNQPINTKKDAEMDERFRMYTSI